jgi:hypothetical protein
MDYEVKTSVKRKLLTVIAVAAIIVGTTTVVSFATTGDDPITAISGATMTMFSSVSGVNEDGDVEQIMARTSEDGVTEYSTDGGETWQVTDEDSVETDGGAKIEFNTTEGVNAEAEAEAAAAAEAGSSSIMTDSSGKTKVTTDGGKTWEDITGKTGEIILEDGSKMTIDKTTDGDAFTVISGEVSASGE